MQKNNFNKQALYNWAITLTMLLLFMCAGSLTFAQDLNDTIITISNDTITCNITLVNNKNIFYDIKDKKRIVHEYISLIIVKEYKLGAKSGAYVYPSTKDSLAPDQKKDTAAAMRQFLLRTDWKNRVLKNSIYIELLGNSMYYSLNYERVLFHKNFFSFSARTGISYLPHSFFCDNMFTVPILVNGVFRFYKVVYGEVGIGAAYLHEEYPDSYYGTEIENYLVITALAGIRLQGYRGFLFRFSFTPEIARYERYSSDNRLSIWLGFSLGYSF